MKAQQPQRPQEHAVAALEVGFSMLTRKQMNFLKQPPSFLKALSNPGIYS